MHKQTPLYALHRESGARIVDFGGWDMPVNYGSQIDEHHAVRRDAGMFDVSHMRVIDVHGTVARDFLRFALANNVDKLKEPGRALYTCMLDERGGILDDLIVYFFGPADYRLVVNAATAEADLAWLRRQASGFAGVTLTPRPELAMIAVQGPNARAKAWQAFPGSEAASATLKPFTAARSGELFIARTGYTGEDGFEITLPGERAVAAWQALVAAGVAPCGLGARDTLRLEAGMNLYGQDMDATVSPLECGLAWTVDLASPRDFVGKAALLAQQPSRMQVGLVLEGAGGVPRAHQAVHTSAGEGEITSGTFSPTLSRSIALARIPAGVAIGSNVEVAIRDKRVRARTVKPPFVRQGKVLV